MLIREQAAFIIALQCFILMDMDIIIDSHFHYLSMLRKDKLSSLPQDLVGIEIGLDGGDLEKRIRAIGEDRRIFLSVGAGPWVLDREDFVSIENELELMERDILLYGADAVGEFGFDNHWKYGSPSSQAELFEREMALSKKHNLASIIHIRDADKELLEHIDLIDERTIMHCFSSDKSVAKKLLDRGAFISFAGNITYKGNTMMQECAKYVPLENLLYETDSPYLSPIPMRGKMNNPAYTEYTAEFIAKIRGIDLSLLKENVIKNLKRALGRSESVVKRDIAI